jgi:cell wall-associated NlpC family hydrolase
MSNPSRPKHAKPSSVRTVLCTGLAAVLLPISVAAPAAAHSAAPASGTVAGTAMRVSGPTGTVAAGRHVIGVRLMQNGHYYPDRLVRIQQTTSKGWVDVGRMLTNGNGLARGSFPFSGSTRVRAVYDGGATSTKSVSPEVAVRVGAAARASRSGGGFRAVALQAALAQRGKPYRWGSTGPNSFDCSGLVGYAFRAAGKNLPRTSAGIRAATKPVPRSAAVPGDLIYSPGHIGIYAGNGKMVDSPRAGKTVSLRPIYARSYEIRRVV